MSSLSFRNCFSMYWLLSFLELTIPDVLDLSSYRLFVRSLIYLNLSSSICMIFLLRVLTSLVLKDN